MGRQLRRVPLDFDHPIGEIWPGFLNPHWRRRQDCPACSGSGRSAAGNLYNEEWYGNAIFDPASTGSVPFSPAHPVVVALAKRNTASMSRSMLLSIEGLIGWYGSARVAELMTYTSLSSPETLALRLERNRLADLFNSRWSHHLAQEDVDALVDAERLMDFCSRPRTSEQAEILREQARQGDSNCWLKDGNGYRPTAAEVNEWSLSGMGHDSINNWVCVKARCLRNGEPVECAACGGSGDLWESAAAEAECQAWSPADPPKGNGWQMWETVSEGSPISPVFTTAEGLARWLAANDRDGSSYETWLRMIIDAGGWAPSFVSTPETGPVTGVEAVGREVSIQ